MKKNNVKTLLTTALLLGAMSFWTSEARANDYTTQMNNFLGYCNQTGHANSQCPNHVPVQAPSIVWVAYVFNPNTGVGYGAGWQGGRNPEQTALNSARNGCRKQQNGCVKGSFFRGKRGSPDEAMIFGGKTSVPTVAIAMGYNAQTGKYAIGSRYLDGSGDLNILKKNALRDCRNRGWQDCHITYTFAH